MLPTGIHFRTYGGDAVLLKTPRARVAVALIVFLLALAPLVAGDYLRGLATQMFITLVAVLGLFVTVGMAGQINVAQSAFVGVGAFATAKLSGYGLPVFVIIPIAALVTGLVSIVFALPAARLKGFYLALTTLAAQVMFPIVILALPTDWLGGLVGMPVEPLSLGPVTLAGAAQLYYFILALVLVATIAAFNLPRSRMGRAMIAVRDNDIAAEVMGVPIFRVKVAAFFAGSLFAGVAGASMAYFLQFVTVASFTLFTSAWSLGVVIGGGLHSPLGAILGVVFITLLQEGLHDVANTLVRSGTASGGTLFALTSIVLGACILIALIFEPRGLAQRWATLRTAFQLWPFPRH